MGESQPLFSLIFPLHDDRGIALHAINGWLNQRTEANPFEIVLIDSGRLQLASKLAKWLSTNDIVVRRKTNNEAVLYNAGAKAATAEWLVFTESHVVPRPGAVSALSCRIRDDIFDAAGLSSIHGFRSRFAQVDAELCGRESDAMRALGLWRTVSLRGFVIRRPVLLSLGMFNEHYNRFAETALAIRLVDAGYRLEEFPEVKVEHFDVESLNELLVAMAQGRLGAGRFWSAEPKLAFDYFGCSAPTFDHDFFNPSLAQSLCLQAGLAILRGNKQAAWCLWQFARPLLFTAILGWRGAMIHVRLRALVAYLRLLKLLHVTHRHEQVRDCQPIVNQYLELRKRCAEIGAVQYQAEIDRVASRQLWELPQTISAESLNEHGTNFFPPEYWRDEQYCWSLPNAAVRLPFVEGGCRIRLDARPTGGWLLRKPKLYLNGVQIPSEDVSETDGIVEIRLPSKQLGKANDVIFSWECEPFVPAESGLPDQRKLGVALIDLRVERATPVMIQQPEECAA